MDLFFLSRLVFLVGEGDVQECGLSTEHKQMLDICRKQRRTLILTNVTLRSWQEEALKFIESPTQRKIVWITGRQGKDRNKWLQSYVESFYMFHRVSHVDLPIKHDTIWNVLRKRPLVFP